MPLHIGRVKADVDVTAQPRGGTPDPAASASSPTVDAETLRPIVVQIVQEELAAFRRQQG
jgi:hypothetical protein